MGGDPALRAILPAPERAAKQRSDDSPADDNGYGSSPVTSQRKLPKRIRSVAQACQMCRQTKAKCDGGRPRCGNCIDRDRTCRYEGEAGQSRQAAMRARLAAFESVFASLRTAAPAEAEKIMARMRTIDDPFTILREGGDNTSGSPKMSTTQTVDQQASQSGPSSSATIHPPHPTQPTQTSPGPSPGTSPRGSPRASPGVDTADSSPRQSVSRMLNADNEDLPFSFSLPSRSLPSSLRSSLAGPLPPITVELVFPSYTSTTRALADFYEYRNPLLHAFSESEAQSLVHVVFGGAPGPPSLGGAMANNECKTAASCLAGIVAVGMRHAAAPRRDHTQALPPPLSFDRFTSSAVYDIAKHHFELVLDASPLLAAKLATLLALFNIMSRNTMAQIWISTGLKLCRACGLASKTPADPNMTIAQWNQQRRVWRTLVFMSSWLTIGVCSITGEMIEVEQISPSELDFFEPSHDIRELLQSETAKISVLAIENLRRHVASEPLSVLSFSTAFGALQGWYASLPASLHLANLPDYSSYSNYISSGMAPFPPDILRSIYHMNLLYLGANLLTYRCMAWQCSRLFREQQQQQQPHQPHHAGYRPETETPESIPVDMLRLGVDAARMTAAVCSTLCRMDSSGSASSGSSGSWIVTLQAYAACIVLLHIVVQKQAHGCHWETWQGDLQRADVCLQVLAAASGGGGVGVGGGGGGSSSFLMRGPHAAAQELYGQVYPFFETLSQATPSPFEVSAEAASSARAPYSVHGRPGTGMRPGQDGYETATLLLTLPMGAPLERTQMPLELMAMVGQPFRGQAELRPAHPRSSGWR